MGNSIVAGLSAKSGPSSDNGKLSAKDQDLQKAEQFSAALSEQDRKRSNALTGQIDASIDAEGKRIGKQLDEASTLRAGTQMQVLEGKNDAITATAAERRAGAIESYKARRDKTKADIAAIDAKVAANKQQRAVQAEATRQRYANKLADFRRDNPVYRQRDALFDYDKAVAANNAMWGAGKRRAQLVQQAKDVFVQSYEKGEFTAAWGLTAGVEAGAGADGEIGKFLSVNFKSGDVSFGVYGSLEAASNLNIPMPEAHAGGAFTFYPTSDYEAALQGKYIIYAGNFDPKVANINVSAGLVKTNNNQLTGFQVGAVVTTPSLAKLPGHSSFVKAGVGDAVRLGTFNYKSWW